MRRSESERELRELREELARIDHALVVLMAARLRAAHRAVRIRRAFGEPATNSVQELVVLDRAREWSEEFGVPPSLAVRMVQVLVDAGKLWEAPIGHPLAPLPSRVVCELRAAGPVASARDALVASADAVPWVRAVPRAHRSEPLVAGSPSH